MSTHNICFAGEITKIIPKLSSNPLLICSPADGKEKETLRNGTKYNTCGKPG